MADLCGGRNQRAGEQRVTTPWNSYFGTVAALAGVASEFSSLPGSPVWVTVQDAVTCVLGQDPGYVDDMATGKLALFKRGLLSLPRVLSLWCLLKYAPCLKMTLRPRSCNATAQSDLMAGWALMHGFVATLDCMEGSWETCMPRV